MTDTPVDPPTQGSHIPAELRPLYRNLWAEIERTIDERLAALLKPPAPRVPSMNVPFGQAGFPLQPGYLLSLGIDSPMRIVGYSLIQTSPLPDPAAVGPPIVPGDVTIDIFRSSRPDIVYDAMGNLISMSGGHPYDLYSIVIARDAAGNPLVDAFGDNFGYAQLGGNWYAEVVGPPPTWSVTELRDGDMLHFFIHAAISIEAGLLRLRLRDLPR